MSRKRKRRGGRRKLEQKQGVRQASLFRYSFLAIILIAGILWGVYEGYKRATSSSRLFDAAVADLRERGQVVFDQTDGSPQRLLICIKQMHGGPSVARLFVRRPERFDLFVKHHDGLRAMLQQQLDQAEIGTVHFFLEGIVGEKEEWEEDVTGVLDNIALIDTALGNSMQRAMIRRQVERLLRGDVEQVQTGLHMLNGGLRFAACSQREGFPVVHGADPPSHGALVQAFYGMLESLRERDDLTDADIEQFIEQIQQVTEDDSRVRHEYVVEQIHKHVPAGGVGVIVLGASHFAVGANYDDADSSQPLEQALSALPNTRTVVVDEVHLSALLTKAPNQIVVGRKMTVDQVRLYLDIQKSK